MKTRIMLVDDSSEQMRDMSTFFEGSEQFDVIAKCDNGVSAVERFEALRPDAMVLDLVMPQMDGFGVLEKINKGEAKIIVLSALSQDTFISKATAMGADYYMIKPTSLLNLADRILECINAPAARAKNSSAASNVNAGNASSIASAPIDVNTQTNNNFTQSPQIKIRNKSIEEKISNIFITVGIPAHIKGYQFLREAIKMAIDCPDIINSITKRLYPDVAIKFETSPSKVERAIRHAIEVAWNRGKIENINTLFGVRVYSHNEKPTNGEFIALVADKLLLESV